jgi:hypothetical protein
MDPYLEPHWMDVHTKFNANAAELLNQVMPADLVASVEERIAVETDEGEPHTWGLDVRVVELAEYGTVGHSTSIASEATAVVPLRLVAQAEPITERFIRVLDAKTERLVTVIEFVSPTNKIGAGLSAFRAKRSELLESGVNFVEVDLVRAGNWRSLLRPHACPRRATTPYQVTIRIPGDPGAVQLYPVGFSDRLPDVKIPLRPNDSPVSLALQELVDRAYVNGRYDRRLDYARPLDPPLEGDDAAWADELLRGAGRR